MSSAIDEGAPSDPPRSVSALLALAAGALDRLVDVAEPVVDEQQYVTDLVTVYRGRFGQVASERGTETVGGLVARAVVVAVEEAGLIGDPHRAIDWLSTLPQVALFALGETA